MLNEINARRCARCHAPPKLDYVRITNVEHNSFLLAPLAKSAGGTEACGQPVFASKDDPDYQALLQTFEALEPCSRPVRARTWWTSRWPSGINAKRNRIGGGAYEVGGAG